MSSVLLTLDDNVAYITLNRPDVHNAFDEAMIQRLYEVFVTVSENPTLRAVVLQSAGKSFCAGGDLTWMQRAAGYTHTENVADAQNLAEMVHALYSCPHPVIASVKGAVFGGGMGLVAACDMVFASEESAVFCLSEVKLGLIPAVITPYVQRAIGARMMGRYALSAERFRAKEAYGMQLVHAVVADDSALEEAVNGYLSTLRANGPQAMRAAKALARKMEDVPISAESMSLTANAIADQRATTEAQEGIRAFFEKRAAEWVA